MEYKIVGGKKFPVDFYNERLDVFMEAFSYSSLSVEDAFNDIKERNNAIRTICEDNMDNFNAYQNLSDDDKNKGKIYVMKLICDIANRYGMFERNISLSTNEEIISTFNTYFSDMIDYLPYLVKLDENGNLKTRDVGYATRDMLTNFLFIKNAQEEVKKMKADYIDAFRYAKDCENIGIPEIKHINALVNRNSDNAGEPGCYKKVNNEIRGANFETCDSSLVPTRMQELLYCYNNNWGDPIKPIDYDIATTKEKHDYWSKVALREARFHIEFERIHPFEDGNGRTGRIILNAHLINSTMAPILITGTISNDYKKRINNRDYDGFAADIKSWSSQQLTNWVSEYRHSLGIDMDYIGFKYPYVEPTEEDLYYTEGEDTSGDGSRH